MLIDFLPFFDVYRNSVSDFMKGRSAWELEALGTWGIAVKEKLQVLFRSAFMQVVVVNISKNHASEAP
jgi:hypothetical protein